MKKYRIKDKYKFVSNLVILIIFIAGGVYILTQQISSCKTEQKDISTKELITQTIIKPTVLIPKTIEVKEVIKTPKYNITLSEELQNYTYNYCSYLNTSYELQLAILRTESNFDSQAVSYTGVCRGMGQLSRTTAKVLAESLQIEDFDIYNAEHNIQCSAYLIKQLSDYWRDEGYCEEDIIGLSLLAYNRGVSGCYKYLKNHDIYEDEYVNKVLQRKSDLEQYREFLN